MHTPHSQKGLTIVELILVITIILILLTTVLLFTNPAFSRSKSRDQKRLSDLQTIERILSEFRLDNGAYPDLESVIRHSNVLPTGRANLTDPRSGWIVANLIEYHTRLPIDPINDDTYRYSYIHIDDVYEINVRLEVLTSEMANDSGNDPNMYEKGTDLTLITP
jgi:type II secretory pathway pseudopilin PulG